MPCIFDPKFGSYLVEALPQVYNPSSVNEIHICVSVFEDRRDKAGG